jgi:adenylate cyclase
MATEHKIEPFSGVGSVLMLDVTDFTSLASGEMSAVDLALVMNAHLEHVTATIAKHGGVIYLYIGDAVAAYWLDGEGQANHAERAVSAARDLLAHPCREDLPRGVKIALDLSIGSGDLVGAYFGPIQQFQIVGAAYSIADRLARSSAERWSRFRSTQRSDSYLEPSTAARN